MRRFLIAAAFLTILVTPPAKADPAAFDSGMHAYKAGDYPAAAIRWYRLAEDGDAKSQYYLGTLYALGRGVPQDDAKAAGWFEKAAAQGHTMAQYSVGPMIGDNLLEAQWNRAAAQRGNAIAQYNVAFMYDEGRGVPQDTVLAHMWFSLAAAGGYTPASDGMNYCESRMSRREIGKARRMAKQWSSSSPAPSARARP